MNTGKKIEGYDKPSYVSVFSSLKYMFSKPITIRYPYEDKGVSERYRGFHINDIDKCIGCGNCRDICPCAAIELVPVDGLEPKIGTNNPYRPQIDYGRCSYCGLCVDVCVTGSLKLSKDLVYSTKDPDKFVWVPRVEQKREIGFRQDFKVSPLILDKVQVDIMPPEDRIKTFEELVLGYTKEQARKEAMRCMGCGLCTQNCPANMKIPEYIDAIYEGDYNKAVKYMLEDNALSGVCGRICTHRCQEVCALVHKGDSLQIMLLKRFAVEAIGFDYEKNNPYVFEKTGKKVAIIGSGPSGLSAAYYLSLMGHSVDIYEKEKVAGGALAYGIPMYRLPVAKLNKEIDYIKSLGVKIHLNTEVGKDIKFAELLQKYDAVYIGVGLSYGRGIRLNGEDTPYVIQALDFLKDVKVNGRKDIVKRVIVIGGGNVAMDVARTAVRLQKLKYPDQEVYVQTVSLEDWDIMPASKEEIEEAQEEGVVFNPAWGPDKALFDDSGKLTGLQVKKVLSVFDENHRFAPKFDENQKKVIEGDLIIEAVGQMYKLDFLGEFKDKLKMTQRRKIWIDAYGHTSIEGVFAGGDLVETSRGDAISAIANGHKAAIGIDIYLRKK